MGKMSRKAKRRKRNDFTQPDQMIQLQNPVAQHFEGFIVGNATKCSEVVNQGEARGQHIVICGAGPSLRDNTEHLAKGDQVWGCNSAMVWLHENGHRVTHGFTVDQTPGLVEEWASAPDVDYLIASTVHPHLVELLESKGRRMKFFHNYVGIRKPPVQMKDGDGVDVVVPFEDWMYLTLYPETIRVGSGLNAVTRAIDLALCMGAHVTVLGADSCLRVKRRPPEYMPEGSPAHMKWLREDCEMHADGGHALASGATAVTVEGEIDGRFWVTKPDMMISAVWLVRMQREFPDRITLIGDTLPNALADKDDAFLDSLPSLTTKDGEVVRYTPPPPEMVAM